MIEYSVRVNGIMVQAAYTERSVQEIFIPLLMDLAALQKSKARRILVMLAAPPGAGKTTLLSFLESLALEQPGMPQVQTIGMDGFHRRQDYLVNHTIQVGNAVVPMVRIKGAPITFDLEALAERIRRVAAGETCGWPTYDRLLHNPVENAETVDGDIVLLEGNYLLLDEEGWRDLASFADCTISVSAEEKMLRDRLIKRRVNTGVAKQEAVRFVDFSDMPNVRLCLRKTMPANLSLWLDENGDYQKGVSPVTKGVTMGA